jgi:hypothetical protein
LAAGRPAGGAADVVDVIDELADEGLPDHLTEAKREERAKPREDEGRRRERRRSVEQRLERAGAAAAE